MAATRVISEFSSTRHNHRRCIREALGRAESVCAKRGMRFTRLRRRFLELVWSRHGPIRAYDILRLMDAKDGSTTPNTVYRGLQFLLDAGLIHRLDSINAYMGCADPETEHTGQFLICRKCDSAAEIHDPGIDRTLGRDAARLGFEPERKTVEVRGVCPSCAVG